MNKKTKAILFMAVGSVVGLGQTLPTVAVPRRFSFSFKPPSAGTSIVANAGAVRGDVCSIDASNEDPMRALISNSNLTGAAHPSFFVDMPALKEDKQASLIVKDDAEEYYTVQAVNVPAGGGLLEIALDSDTKELTTGIEYTWFFQLHCDDLPAIDDPLISASIKRVDVALSDDLYKNMEISAKNNLWFDAIESAIKLEKMGNKQYLSELLSIAR